MGRRVDALKQVDECLHGYMSGKIRTYLSYRTLQVSIDHNFEAPVRMPDGFALTPRPLEGNAWLILRWLRQQILITGGIQLLVESDQTKHYTEAQQVAEYIIDGVQVSAIRVWDTCV